MRRKENIFLKQIYKINIVFNESLQTNCINTTSPISSNFSIECFYKKSLAF